VINAAHRVVLAAAALLLQGCSSKSREPALGVRPEVRAEALSVDQIKFTPWSFADCDGQLISTPHYRIYTTMDEPRVTDRLAGFYERALEHYTTALAELPGPDAPLTTYLFKNRQQWQLKTQQMLPEQAGMFTNLGRGGFTTKGISVLYYIDFWSGFPRDTLAIAAHEGWHQYTQQTFKHQLPIWLEEGVATFMEGYRVIDGEPQFQAWANPERREALNAAVRSGQLISLDELLTRTPQSFLDNGKNRLLRYYSQVWGLTRFLAEGEDGRYRQSLALLLSDAAHGRLAGRLLSSAGPPRARTGNRIGTTVIYEYFNHDLAEFEMQYMAFIRKIAEPNTRPRTAGNDNTGR
jgi:hypothetical protein